MNRRSLVFGVALACGGCVGAEGGMVSDAGSGSPTMQDAGPTKSVELPTLAEITASDGVADGEIAVAFSTGTIFVNDWRSDEIREVPVNLRMYNGNFPGPTIRLRANEQINLSLINDLPANSDANDTITNVNFPHHINSTNFHTHGLHVDPTGNGDNVVRAIAPGVVLPVVVDVPSNHNPGTFWYHGHKHGANQTQFLSGMTGPIIVEGDVDAVPEIAAATEKILMFNSIAVDADGEVPDPNPSATEPGEIFGGFRTYHTTNGVVNPIIRIAPGEVQRWRLINGTLRDFLDLSLEGHSLHQIAMDGITLGSVTSLESFQMSPGNRTDVLIKAGSVGTYELRSPVRIGAGTLEVALATLIVEGSPNEMGLPTNLPTPDYILPDTTSAVPDDTRTTEFSVDETGLNRFKIDGKVFDKTCTDHLLQKGDLIEWEVSNTSMGDHPFHIHTNSFQVLEIDGEVLEPPVWHDVVNVPAMGTVRVRTRIDDFVGGIVLHCHVISHEDLGMMQNVVIVDDTLPEADRVLDPGVDPNDASMANPNVPNYYVSENFTLCQ